MTSYYSHSDFEMIENSGETDECNVHVFRDGTMKQLQVSGSTNNEPPRSSVELQVEQVTSKSTVAEGICE